MEDLEVLLTKIRKEGLEKAEIEGASVLKTAQDEATAIIEKAKDEAKAIQEKAKSEANMLMRGGEATLKQAARDVLLSLEKDISNLLQRTLAEEVDETLQDANTIAKFVEEAILASVKDDEAVEIVVPETALETVRAKLAQWKALTVVTNHQMGTGFKIYRNKGRIEHDFSGEAVADALGKLLRPQLAALLK